MSDYIKLIINGIEADYFQGQDLPLNIKRRISNEEGEPAGNFTRSTLRLPATKTNKSILDGQKELLTFSIEVSGAEKLSGNLQVKSLKLVNNGYRGIEEIFEVNLTGGSSDWFTLLRGCKLSDLNNDVAIFDEAEILSGYNANPDATNYGFTLIKWHEWQNSKVITEPNPAGGTISRQLETPSVYESTPFIFIRSFIISAFQKVGYTVQSTFLNSDFFKRLIMPVPLTQKMPEEYNEQYLNFSASLDVLNVLTTTPLQTQVPYNVINEPPQNPGVWNNVLFEYTAPEAGYYEVEIGATYGPEVGIFDFVYIQVATVNGLAGAPGAGGFGDGSILGPSTFPTGETRRTSYVFQVAAGDKIAIQQITFTDTNFTLVNNFVNIRGEALRAPGLNIRFSAFLTKYEFLPMLKDLVYLFKLAIDTNEDNKSVIIEPSEKYRYTDRLTSTDEIREGYYFMNQNIDYSQKLDYSTRPVVKFPKLDGQINYTYKSDDDETTKSVEENEPFLIYEGQYFPGNGADLSRKNTKTTEFFAKTLHVFDNFTKYNETNINPQYPLIYPQDYIFNPTATPDDANYDITPRILYFAGQRGGVDGYIEIFETGLQTELPAAFMVNYNDVTGLDANLSFCREEINGVSIPGILENYHIDCLERMSQRETLKSNVLQNAIEFDNFSFRNRAIIDEKRYIIQETETVNPLQRVPAVFLFVLDRFADEQTRNKIVNSNLRGVVSLFR